MSGIANPAVYSNSRRIIVIDARNQRAACACDRFDNANMEVCETCCSSGTNIAFRPQGDKSTSEPSRAPHIHNISLHRACCSPPQSSALALPCRTRPGRIDTQPQSPSHRLQLPPYKRSGRQRTPSTRPRHISSWCLISDTVATETTCSRICPRRE